jgi:hypothetical protein
VTLTVSAQQQFSATVLNASSTAVEWHASGGTIDANGLFTAPSAPASVTVTATSLADPARSAQALVEVVAAPAIAVQVSPGAATLLAGRPQQFTASVVNDPLNRGVTWTASAGSVDASGLFTAPASAGVVTVTATSKADQTKSASATITVAELSIAVTPPAIALQTGATQQFTATVTGWSDAAVTWSASAGAVSATGLFTAPATAGTVTVTATSVADPTRSASATVTVVAPTVPLPVVVSVTPGTATLLGGAQQQFAATVSNAADTGVTWSASAGTITATGLFTAPVGPTSVTVTARSRADPTKTASAVVDVRQISIAVAPATASVALGATRQFTATVTGWANAAVTWSASAGSITASGLFTAPANLGHVTVTATSVADPTRSASAAVTVTHPSLAEGPHALSLSIAAPGASVPVSGISLELVLPAGVTVTTSDATTGEIASAALRAGSALPTTHVLTGKYSPSTREVAIVVAARPTVSWGGEFVRLGFTVEPGANVTAADVLGLNATLRSYKVVGVDTAAHGTVALTPQAATTLAVVAP